MWCVRAPAATTSEKTDQAMVSEVVSGLLASGAPIMAVTTTTSSSTQPPLGCSAQGGPQGGLQGGHWVLRLLDIGLRSTSLEMADSWALCVR